MKSLFVGNSLKARSLRTTALAVASLGGENILRLASNLILTRILFPEVFGLMALVQLFLTGLKMFSDTGIRQAIIQNPRGEEPDFLNTAWTAQIIRGVILWACTCALALPAAALYGEPLLAQILPVAAFSLVISGFMTTKVLTNNRNLTIGQQTITQLSVKTIEIIISVTLAWWLQSVWALVIGNLASSFLSLLANHRFLPGQTNRLHWDWEIARELFGFGKFIFLSTAVTFVTTNGDRAILGAYISLAELGVYNIGYFLGALPLLVYQAVMGRVVFPYYRLKPIAGNLENKRKIFQVRRLVIASGLLGTFIMSASGIALIDLLYDSRYALAGPVVVVLSLSLVPRLVLNSYGAIFMSSGDTRQVFYLSASTAAVQTVLMFVGVTWLGILGVMIAPGLAIMITYPFRIRAVRRHNAWDPLADAVLLSAGYLINGFFIWWHWDQVVKLI